MNDSTRCRSRGKSLKNPRKAKDFPLRIHKGSGYWCKKVGGRVFYFGKVADDPKGVAALAEWMEEKESIRRYGEKSREQTDPAATTVEQLAFKFLEHHEARRDNGEISPRTFQTYLATCKTVAETLGRNRAVSGLVSDDFRKLKTKLAKTRGLVALKNEMTRVRSLFKFADKAGLIATPVTYAMGFEVPSNDAISRVRESQRAEHGDRMFEAAEIRHILAACGQPLKAMTLLAVNCGYGQTDCSSLPLRAVDLDGGWVVFPRPKSGVRRRCALWPETIDAIREWLTIRPTAKHTADEGLLFLTCRGSRWVKLNKTGSPSDAIGQEFVKVLKALGLKRRGVSFYAMRHGFETIAGETTDQIAVDHVMGHKTPGMAAVYRERISDDRLRRVAEHVRRWLFADAPDDTGARIASETIDPCDPIDPVGSQEGQGSQESGSDLVDDKPRFRIVG